MKTKIYSKPVVEAVQVQLSANVLLYSNQSIDKGDSIPDVGGD